MLVETTSDDGVEAAMTPPIRATAPPPRRWERRRVAVAAIALVGIAVVWVGGRIAVGGVIHANRQRHLAAEMATGRPIVGEGDAVAILQIPQLGVNEVVALGVSDDVLRGGPALEATGAMPGRPGTALILAHREAYGGPFARLETLSAGARVAVLSRNSRPVEFTVVDVTTIAGAPEQLTTIARPAAAPARLVLVTSTGGGFDSAMHVVVAEAMVPGAPVDGHAAPTPSLERGSFVNRHSLAAILAGFNACAVAVMMRRLGRRRLAWIALPIALYAAVNLQFCVDLMWPLLR